VSIESPWKIGVDRMIDSGFPERYAERKAEKVEDADVGRGKMMPEMTSVMLG
jgi:hypothetical protein